MEGSSINHDYADLTHALEQVSAKANAVREHHVALMGVNSVLVASTSSAGATIDRMRTISHLALASAPDFEPESSPQAMQS